jgi:hypothetical protein
MRARDFLIEMVVRHRTHDMDGATIVAFKDSVWALNHDDPDLEAALQDIYAKSGLECESLDDINSEITDNRPDVLLGNIHNDELVLWDRSEIGLNPESSKLVRKTVQALRLNGVTTEHITPEGDEYDHFTHKWNVLGELPDTAYHGTSTRWLAKIVKQGLRPDTDAGNWERIAKFRDRVFLAVNINKAIFHANHACEARTYDHPVVIKVRIPDKHLIDLDYDVAVKFLGADSDGVHHTYTHAAAQRAYVDMAHHEIKQHSPGVNWNRETGVFSYKGRIPASFIVSFLVRSREEQEFTPENSVEVTPRELSEYFDDYMEFGFYDPIAFDEMRSYREDEDDEEE